MSAPDAPFISAGAALPTISPIGWNSEHLTTYGIKPELMHKWLIQNLLVNKDISIVLSDKILCMGIDLPIRSVCLVNYKDSIFIANLKDGFMSGFPPKSLAAKVISLDNLVKIAPLLASAAPFLRLIVDHLL